MGRWQGGRGITPDLLLSMFSFLLLLVTHFSSGDLSSSVPFDSSRSFPNVPLPFIVARR